MRMVKCYDCGKRYNYDEEGFCPKCGAEVKSGAPFCTNCGAKMG